MKKIKSKKGVSEIITVLIIAAVIGGAGFTVFKAVGSSATSSGTAVTGKVNSALTTAANGIN